MPNIEQHNLRQLINNHFFDRDQTKEILENFVTVDNNSVLHVGLPEPANVALTTPNNAITTADVGTLKAKVTDSNSNNCYGVPVDFVNRKTREVIGQGITDLNGEAYYNFRLEDSDIFSVQAKLSQDYLFHDGAILNNTATWGNSGNIVQEIYHDYTLIYKDDDSLDSLLYSPTLSGYTEISFKAKLVDAAANDSFCGIIETNSSGTVTGNLNGVTLSQLGLTAANNGQWYKFYINVLGTDVLIKAINLDTGAVSTASVTLSAAMSYFSFCFVLTGDLTTTYFSDVKINKCSDDLTMFVKDKSINYIFWDIGGTNIDKWDTSRASGLVITYPNNECTQIANTNVTSSTTTYLSSSVDISGDWEAILEVNIPQYAINVGQYFGLRNFTISKQTIWRATQTGWRYYKLRRVNGEYTGFVKVNESDEWVSISPQYNQLTNNEQALFCFTVYNPTQTEHSIQFKKVIIYEI